MTHNADSRFGAWISVLNRAAQVYFTRVLEPYSIGPGQQAYLLVLEPGERVSQQEIGLRLSMDKANVARSVQSLVSAGYFARRRSADDKRRWEVSLTKAGAHVRSEIEALMQGWVAAIRSDVTEEEWTPFVETLAQIASRAMEHAGSG